MGTKVSSSRWVIHMQLSIIKTFLRVSEKKTTFMFVPWVDGHSSSHTHNFPQKSNQIPNVASNYGFKFQQY